MSRPPLLTIAIPTYNRAVSLRRSLGAFIDQMESLPACRASIEVLVSDNCSSDSTPEVVAGFQSRHPIRYLRNDRNLGMEGNFLQCFESASGRIVWIFSDDDVIVDGALARICRLLASQPVDLIYIQPKFRLGELDSFDVSERGFRLLPVTNEYFALRANGLLSFLSAVLVNKQRYLDIRSGDSTRRYQGTWLAHYEWIYTLMARGSHLYIASEPAILARTGATGGYDIFEVFCDHYTRIGRELLGSRERMRLDLEGAMLYMHIPGFISRCRAQVFGRFEYVPERIARQIGDTYGRSMFFHFVIRPQLFGSRPVAAAAYRLSQAISRIWLAWRRTVTRRARVPAADSP